MGSRLCTVHATKNGTVPIMVEARTQHTVMVVSNIARDLAHLFFLLKQKLGTRGVLRTNTTENSDGGCRLEIHGKNTKQINTIQRYICVEAKCLIGASKQTKEAIVRTRARARR